MTNCKDAVKRFLMAPSFPRQGLLNTVDINFTAVYLAFVSKRDEEAVAV